jgi:tetratricopeptide (TPR) repeat protein
MALTIAKREGEAGLPMAVGLLAKQGRWDEALALIEQGEDSDLRTALRAWAAHEAGRDDEAISGLRSHLYAKGTDLDAYRVLIRIFMSQGKNRLARLACQGALRIAPKEADIHYLLGRIDAQLGRFAGSRRAFEAAIKFDPSHLGARTELARTGLDHLDYKGALAHMNVAYRLAPGDEEVALLTAVSLRANGACAEASSLLDRWKDRSARALFNLGVLKLRCLDQPKEALALLRRYVEKSPPHEDHQVHLLLQEAELLSETE